MNLLITSLHYAPEATGNAPYATAIAEHMASRGHSVTVVTGFPSYPMWRSADQQRWLLWKRETIRGVDVRRRWHYVPQQQSMFTRGLFEASFLLTGLSTMTLPRPDLVIGVVPSLSGGLLARLLGQRFRVPYGVIFQDLVAQSAKQSGVRGARAVASPVRIAEGWVARGAAVVGIIADGFRPYIESLGVESERITCLRNWTHIAEPAIDRHAVRERLNLPQDAIVCLHAGNMGYKQGLENVVKCARIAANSDPRLLFVMVGDGNRRASLEALAASYSLPNLRFLPIQPEAMFPSVLAAADMLLVNQSPGVTDMSLPSKLTSYFAVGRPVVAAVDPESETASEIEASNGGLAVPADRPQELLRAVQTLAADEELSNQLGQSGRAWSLATLSKASAMESYERFFAAVQSGGIPSKESYDMGIDLQASAIEEGANDGDQQLLDEQISSRHRRRRLSRPARRPEAPESGRDSTLRAA